MRIVQSFRGHKEVAAFSLNAVRERRECEKDEGMVRLVPDIRGSDSGAAGLLIECRGQSPAMLQVGLWAGVSQGFLGVQLPLMSVGPLPPSSLCIVVCTTSMHSCGGHARAPW